MTVSLGGLALSEHLLLDIGPASAGMSQRRLIGGALLVQTDPATGGRSLTLSGENHWSLAQVEAVRALQSQGLPMELVHHRGTFAAVIADTSDLTPSFGYADPAPDDWYTGSITLIEV